MKGKPFYINGVPCVRCYCCGNFGRNIVGDQLINLHLVRPAMGEIPAEYRCDRHLGRNPCEIDLCGRTFASNDVDEMFVCAKHWRQAPKYMRDAVARVRRIGHRLDWPEAIRSRHHRLWHRAFRAIVEGHNLDIARIEREFGL